MGKSSLIDVNIFDIEKIARRFTSIFLQVKELPYLSANINLNVCWIARILIIKYQLSNYVWICIYHNHYLINRLLKLIQP